MPHTETKGKLEELRTKGKIIDYEIISLDVPDVPDEEQDKRLITTKYVPFGADNLFPQHLGALARQSVYHRSLLNSKKVYSQGTFDVENADASVIKFLAEKNARGETFRSIFDKLLIDKLRFGNEYLLIIADKIEHLDSSKCRVGKDNESIMFHPDWTNFEATKNKTLVFAKYPKEDIVRKYDGTPAKNGDKIKKSVYHFKQYEPEFDWYGIPEYIAGLDVAGIAYKTNKWQLSQLNNSFKSPGLVEIVASMSPENAKKVKKSIKDTYTGEGNNDQVVVIIKEPGAEASSYTPFIHKMDGDWIELNKLSLTELVMAHGWYRSLTSIPDNTGFDTTRILNEFDIASKIAVQPIQESILEPIRMLMAKYFDLSGLKMINVPPLSMISSIDINRVTKIYEGRKIAGLPYDEEDVSQQKYIIEANGISNRSGNSN